MRLPAWSLGLLLLCIAAPARADVEDVESSYRPKEAERRSDFTFGALLGPTVGSSTGYMNELEQIGNPAYEQRTGAGFGLSSGLWLGGALRDWFVFGLGVRSAWFEAQGKRSEGGGFVLRIETYPLFARGGVFRDLALIGEFGLGGRTIKEASKTVADGGSTSYVGIGAHWEAFRYWGSFAGGPALLVMHEFSDSMQSTYGVLAFRTAFYGGP